MLLHPLYTLAILAESAPSFPTELSANVTMDTIEPGMPEYKGSYQVWQSLSQGLSTIIGDDGAGGTQLTVTMPSPPSASSPITAYSVYQGRCYCVRYDIPAPPEFEQWKAAPPPTSLGVHSVDGRPCAIWQQHGWLVSNDTFSAAFGEMSGEPVQWTWRSNGIKETKAYSTLVSATPPPEVFAVPSECNQTKCTGYETGADGTVTPVWRGHARQARSHLTKLRTY
mmetsp:Transcript_12845/g.32868  ORF Transcript_12845/g.32868 Transcript_12845/m.32868 type:complete len:225 (-) Transcript_12845:274-948(-)